jgi:hypothetical protein
VSARAGLVLPLLIRSAEVQWMIMAGPGRSLDG